MLKREHKQQKWEQNEKLTFDYRTATESHDFTELEEDSTLATGTGKL